MPFDATPITDHAKALPRLDAAAFDFLNSLGSTNSAKLRPIPPWHSSLHPERMTSTLTVLLRARELIADEQRWCRRTYARGWRGIPVPVQSAGAHRFCALGAIMRAGGELGLPVDDAHSALEWQTVRPVQDWNDDPVHTHRDVVAAFDASIAAIERSGAPRTGSGGGISRR
jgi:hypothetical protein